MDKIAYIEVIKSRFKDKDKYVNILNVEGQEEFEKAIDKKKFEIRDAQLNYMSWSKQYKELELELEAIILLKANILYENACKRDKEFDTAKAYEHLANIYQDIPKCETPEESLEQMRRVINHLKEERDKHLKGTRAYKFFNGYIEGFNSGYEFIKNATNK